MNLCRLFNRRTPEPIEPDDRPPTTSARVAAARRNPPSPLWDYLDRTLRSEHARQLLEKALENAK